MLTDRFVRTVKTTKPTRYGDGRGGLGLSLLVKPMTSEPGRMSKTWSARLTVGGRRTMVGLGSYPVVTLARARELALAHQQAVEQGRNPALAVAPTFTEALERTLDHRRPSWRPGPGQSMPRTEADWRASLAKHVLPHIGTAAVDKITRTDVFRVLEPLWRDHPATGKHVADRIGAVLTWAMGAGFRDDDPTEAALAALGKPRTNGARHHDALEHNTVAAALAAVDRASTTYPSRALALRFLALTAARSAEVLGMTRAEIDFDAAVWTVPADRYKTGRAHRVPLSPAAMAVLSQAAEISTGPVVFPRRGGGTMPDNALRQALTRAKVEATVHGLRSSFRDWAAETGVSREAAEAALGHVVGGVEGAYRRTDLLDARREVMAAWANHIGRS